MKWGRMDGISQKEKLLYWVLMYVLMPYFNDPLDHWLKEILGNIGGLAGDPGWEMERVSDGQGQGRFRVSADPNVSGIEPAEAFYSIEMVRFAARESLMALGHAYPDKLDEAKEVIRRYKLLDPNETSSL